MITTGYRLNCRPFSCNMFMTDLTSRVYIYFLIHLGQVVILWRFKLYKCGYLYHADMFYQSEGGSQNFLWLKENNQKWEKKVTRMTQQNKGGINNKLADDSGGIRNWSVWIYLKTFVLKIIKCPNNINFLKKDYCKKWAIYLQWDQSG